MRTQNKVTIDVVRKLAQIIEQRKALEKQEKEFKAAIRQIMGENAVLEAGDFCVNVKSCSRPGLDSDAIMHDLGKEFFDLYNKLITYDTMEVIRTKITVASGY